MTPFKYIDDKRILQSDLMRDTNGHTQPKVIVSYSTFPEAEAVVQWCSVEQNKLWSATLLEKRLWHRCFPVIFAKFLRIPFFKEHLWWLLLQKHLLSLTVIFVQKIKGINWFRSEIDDLKVNSCRFGNLSIFSNSYKNNTLKISHS